MLLLRYDIQRTFHLPVIKDARHALLDVNIDVQKYKCFGFLTTPTPPYLRPPPTPTTISTEN